MPQQAPRSRLFTPEYCAMIALGLLNCLFGQSSMAIIPILMDSRGVSEFAAAVLNILFPLSCLFFRRCAVKLGSMVSSRRSICFCFVVLAVSNLALDAIQWMIGIVFIRISQGLSICYIAGVIASLVAETVPADRFAEGMGYFSIGIPVMSFFGPALCRVLLGSLGYSKMLWGISLIMVIPIVLSLAAKLPNLRPAAPAGPRQREPFLEKASVPPSLLLMGSAMAATCTVSFLPLYAQRYGLQHTLSFYMAAGVGVFGIRIFSTLFHKNIPEARALPLSTAILAAVLVILPLTDQIPLYLLMGLFYGMAIGIIQPYFIALALKAAAPSHKSIATVTYYMFNDVGTSAGGMLWGYIAQYLSYYSVFVTAAGINLLTLLGWLVLLKGRPDPALSASSGAPQERSAQT